jgi:AcrR family transcriptional regulator
VAGRVRAGSKRPQRLQSNVPAPQRPARKAGRPIGGDSEETRERILNAAEELFALNGYDGTSVRDVAAASQVQIAAVGYHFGLKESLFDTVIGRRAVIMSQWRMRSLAQLRKQHGADAIALDALIRAYIWPFYESASHGDPGWRNYAALMGRLANSALGTEVIARHFDPTARAYLDEFVRTLPGASVTAIVDGFLFMVASMLALCAASEAAQARARLVESV